MSRRNWSPEQRAAAAARMRAMNADPAFRAAKIAACRRPECRAARAEVMRATNARMQEDPALKEKWLAAVSKTRRTKAYRARAAEQMRQRMASDTALQEAASLHARQLNADPATRKRQVDGRRRAVVPHGFEETYRILRRKVGRAEALRLVREEAVRQAQRAAQRQRGGS